MIEVTNDVKNTLLDRREISCTFRGLAGKMKKLEAVDMISKQFKLDGKIIVPIMLKNETGRPMVSGTFYIYDDEKLARLHLKPAIFTRLDKLKGVGEKAEEVKESPVEKAEKKEAKEASVEKEEKKKEVKEVPVENAEKKKAGLKKEESK